MQDGVSQVHLAQAEARIGRVQVGLRNCNVFLATALDRLVVALLCSLKSSLCALQGSCRQVAILGGDLIFAEQLKGALVVELLLVQIGLCVEHGLMRGLLLLLTGSCQSQRKVRFADADRSLVNT